VDTSLTPTVDLGPAFYIGPSVDTVYGVLQSYLLHMAHGAMNDPWKFSTLSL